MKRYIMLVLGCLILAFFFLITDFNKVIVAISEEFSWEKYIVLFVSINLYLILKALRFKLLMLYAYAVKTSYKNVFHLISASFFLALVTPGKVGELSRPFFANKNRLKIGLVTIYEYLLDIFLMLFIPIACVLYFDNFSFYMDEFLLVALMFFILFYALYKFKSFLMSLIYYLLKKNKKFADEKFQLNDVRKDFFDLLKKKQVLFTSIIFTIATHFVYFLILFIILKDFGSHIHFWQVIVALSLGILVGVFTFMPFGLGTRDLSTYGFLIFFGVDPLIAATSVIILRSLTISLLLFSGASYFFLSYRK
jgi:uncharacterized protein (TIRG00374 family)